MNAIVVYKTKYGSTKTYAEWISEELGCEMKDAKDVSVEELENYDTIVYGGGLYAEAINGASLITKNIETLKDKKIAIYSTGITPLEYREYYDKLVIERNFKNGVPDCVKLFNFTDAENVCAFKVVLPAGNTKNIGLQLVLKAIGNHINSEIDYSIVKLDMFTEDMTQFA